MYFFMEIAEDIINNMNYVVYVYEMLINVPLETRRVSSLNNGEYSRKNEVSNETLFKEYQEACMYFRYITDYSLRDSLTDVYSAIAYVSNNHPFFKVDMKIPDAMVTFCNSANAKTEIKIASDEDDFYVPIVAIKKKEKTVPARRDAIGYLGLSVLRENVSVS